LILTGSTAGNANFGGGALSGSGGSNNFDIVVAKYDSAGAHQWSRAFGDSYNQWGCSIGTDASGDVYASGQFSSSADLDGKLITAASVTTATNFLTCLVP